MGAPSRKMLQSMQTAPVIFAAFAMIAVVHAAPFPVAETLFEQQESLFDELVQPTTYEQEQTLYESLVQETASIDKKAAKAAKAVKKAGKKATKKAFKEKDTGVWNKVTPDSKTAKTNHEEAIKARVKERQDTVLAPAKIEDTANKAEVKETEAQDKIKKADRTKVEAAQAKAAAAAAKALKTAETTGTKTNEAGITQVHKDLHPDPKQKDQEDRVFAAGMAGAASGAETFPTNAGKQFTGKAMGNVVVKTGSPKKAAKKAAPKAAKKADKKK